MVKNFQGQNTDIPSYLFHSKKMSLTNELEKINKIRTIFQHSFFRQTTYLSELKNLTCDVYSVVSGSNMCHKTVLLCKKNIISNLVLFQPTSVSVYVAGGRLNQSIIRAAFLTIPCYLSKWNSTLLRPLNIFVDIWGAVGIASLEIDPLLTILTFSF